MNLIERLAGLGLYVATAESLTAGLICAKLVETPGASKVVLGGVVAYQNEIKQNLLAVPEALISKASAVDAEVAVLMASAVRSQFGLGSSKNLDQVIGISATGVAGPLPVGDHEVGEVFIGISSARSSAWQKFSFAGNRDQIRQQSVASALVIIREHLDEFWG
jgi:nicotinamide-nucleotide amidase